MIGVASRIRLGSSINKESREKNIKKKRILSCGEMSASIVEAHFTPVSPQNYRIGLHCGSMPLISFMASGSIPETFFGFFNILLNYGPMHPEVRVNTLDVFNIFKNLLYFLY